MGFVSFQACFYWFKDKKKRKFIKEFSLFFLFCLNGKKNKPFFLENKKNLWSFKLFFKWRRAGKRIYQDR